MILNTEDFASIFGVKALAAYSALSNAMERFSICSALCQAHFLSQAGYESLNFSHTVEYLDYTVMRLQGIFPRFFSKIEKAQLYAHKPMKIANLVYSNRLGNGDEESGDGWKYRGRGYIQLTGKDNYELLGQIMSLDLINKPEILANIIPAAISAAAWWENANLNLIASQTADLETTRKLTLVINGSAQEAPARFRLFKSIFSIINKKETENEQDSENAHKNGVDASANHD